MMGKTRSFQEALATLFEDKRLLKESRNKEQNKRGGIMEENKIRKRKVVVLIVGQCKAVQSNQYDTLNMMDVLKGNQSELQKRQMEENKIKEAQKGMKEEQGNKPIHFVPLPFERKLLSPEESTLSYSDVMAFQRTLIEKVAIMKKKRDAGLERDPFDEKMKISRFLFRGGRSWRKQFFRKGRNKREQWKSEKVRKSVEIWGRNAFTQHAALQQRGKLINITKDHAGFDDAEKGGGKRAICADFHLESRPDQADNLYVVHAECRPKCPLVVNVKKRNAGQTSDVATQTFPVREPGRNGITQHAAPQQRGKLNDIAEDQCELDDTEKGGGKQSVCADCHLKSPHTINDDHFVVHAECRPKCPFVVNDKKRNAGQTNDVATQAFPLREPGEAISRRNGITQHAAPQQRGKLNDIAEDQCEFDDTEKGGGKQSVCADCHLRFPHTSNDVHFVEHAECRPKCPFVVNDKKRNAGQTNDVATQTFPLREPGEAISRGNAITQHAAPQQSGKLIDITEDQCEFDDTEKEIQEMDELLRCKVCLDNDACIVFLPCRHMATCEYCEGFLNHCPVCRSFIEEALKINEE